MKIYSIAMFLLFVNCATGMSLKELEEELEWGEDILEELLHPPMADPNYLEANTLYRCKEGELHFYTAETGLGHGYRCQCEIKTNFRTKLGHFEQSRKWFCLRYFQDDVEEERIYLDKYSSTKACEQQFSFYAGNLCRAVKKYKEKAKFW